MMCPICLFAQHRKCVHFGESAPSLRFLSFWLPAIEPSVVFRCCSPFFPKKSIYSAFLLTTCVKSGYLVHHLVIRVSTNNSCQVLIPFLFGCFLCSCCPAFCKYLHSTAYENPKRAAVFPKFGPFSMPPGVWRKRLTGPFYVA